MIGTVDATATRRCLNAQNGDFQISVILKNVFNVVISLMQPNVISKRLALSDVR